MLFSTTVEADLKSISAFQKRILDDIEKQLAHQPTTPTKNKKLLVDLLPPWEARSAVWELRSGEYRVFYDSDEDKQVVYIRAVRKKPHGKRTEEIL